MKSPKPAPQQIITTDDNLTPFQTLLISLMAAVLLLAIYSLIAPNIPAPIVINLPA